MIVILIVTGKNVQSANIKRKASLDDKTITTHDLYNCIKEKKTTLNKIMNIFDKETLSYLKNNYKYNIVALSIIYIILGCHDML